MVSIIIATYNAAKTLPVALSSVANQTFQDWECVIVDGASNDNTIDIVNSYVEKDKRFRYISEPDKGIYDALNKGVSIALGEWIYVLGSDDELLPNSIELLIGEGHNYDIVYGNTINKYDDGSTKLFKAKSINHLKYVMCCSHQGLIMKRIVINAEGGFNLLYPIRADFDLFQRCYLKKYRILQTDIPVAYYYTGGISGTSNLSSDIERYHILKNNNSTKIPLLAFTYYFLRKIVRIYIVSRIKELLR